MSNSENQPKDRRKSYFSFSLSYPAKPDDDEFNEYTDRDHADWKRVRALIEHEDTLINHRTTWLLTSNAFLFAGIYALVSWKLVDSGEACVLKSFIGQNKMEFGCLGVALLGLIVSAATANSIRAAAMHLERTAYWWRAGQTRLIERISHPVLIGHVTGSNDNTRSFFERNVYSHVVLRGIIPSAFYLTWSFLFCDFAYNFYTVFGEMSVSHLDKLLRTFSRLRFVSQDIHPSVVIWGHYAALITAIGFVCYLWYVMVEATDLPPAIKALPAEANGEGEEPLPRKRVWPQDI